VDAIFSTQGHPTPETLEEYAFERLSEADTEVLEEHLLVCADCQGTLGDVDEYILLMKHAAARPPTARAKPMDARMWGGRIVEWERAPWRPVYAACAVVLALAVSVTVLKWPVRTFETAETRVGATESVQLLALRGGEPATGQAHERQPVDLSIDLTDLPVADRYRVEVVNAAGAVAWDAEVMPSSNALRAHLAKGLHAGTYWVRLYSSGALLREFGLRVQ
jgi:hypothetical protein